MRLIFFWNFNSSNLLSTINTSSHTSTVWRFVNRSICLFWIHLFMQPSWNQFFLFGGINESQFWEMKLLLESDIFYTLQNKQKTDSLIRIWYSSMNKWKTNNTEGTERGRESERGREGETHSAARVDSTGECEVALRYAAVALRACVNVFTAVHVCLPPSLSVLPFLTITDRDWEVFAAPKGHRSYPLQRSENWLTPSTELHSWQLEVSEFAWFNRARGYQLLMPIYKVWISLCHICYGYLLKCSDIRSSPL